MQPATAIPSHARPARGPDFTLEELGGEYVLYDPRTERIMELNASAALVLQLCDGARSVDEIVALVTEAFPDEGERVEADVRATLAALVASGTLLIEQG